MIPSQTEHGSFDSFGFPARTLLLGRIIRYPDGPAIFIHIAYLKSVENIMKWLKLDNY